MVLRNNVSPKDPRFGMVSTTSEGIEMHWVECTDQLDDPVDQVRKNSTDFGTHLTCIEGNSLFMEL